MRTRATLITASAVVIHYEEALYQVYANKCKCMHLYLYLTRLRNDV